jgi:hypothetical protein
MISDAAMTYPTSETDPAKSHHQEPAMIGRAGTARLNGEARRPLIHNATESVRPFSVARVP